MPKSNKKAENFRFPHLVNDKNKIVFIHVQNHISAMGVETMMKNKYPGYKSKLVSSKEFKNLGGIL